jgi:hypothetical protein
MTGILVWSMAYRFSFHVEDGIFNSIAHVMEKNILFDGKKSMKKL